MSDKLFDVVIIGAGASGLMLAANLDAGDFRGIVLEGTSSIGSKLLMSGGGRCNITHGGPIKDFVRAYGEAGKALRKCLYRHSNSELLSRLESFGLSFADEKGNPLTMAHGHSELENIGRIFPASMKARDVLNTLIGEAASNMWQIETDARVCGLRKVPDPYHGSVAGVDEEKLAHESDKDELWEINLESRGCITARNIVAATGGITYPETGSDGSMLEILRSLGIGVKEPRSALAPIYVDDYPYAELAGISISGADVSITKRRDKREKKSEKNSKCTESEERGRVTSKHDGQGRKIHMNGDILFTHDGFSGPVILNISKYAEPGDCISISYAGGQAELPRRLFKLLQERSKSEAGDIRTKQLAAFLESDDFVVSGVDKRGMVTGGGVMLEEIEMHTMKCKSFDNLYVIGEALDIDGLTGGYNLQMCWSTACTCADDLKEKMR